MFFYPHPKGLGGAASYCKDCSKRNSRLYKKKKDVKLRISAYNKKWRKNNLPKVKQLWRAYYKKRADYLKQKRAERYWSNPEFYRRKKRTRDRLPDIRKKNKEYRLSPKGRAVYKRATVKRRSTLKNIVSNLTHEEWMQIKRGQAFLCKMCGKRKKLEMDHILPISRGGNHTKENIQGLCRFCNASKGAKIF